VAEEGGREEISTQRRQTRDLLLQLAELGKAQVYQPPPPIPVGKFSPSSFPSTTASFSFSTASSSTLPHRTRCLSQRCSPPVGPDIQQGPAAFEDGPEGSVAHHFRHLRGGGGGQRITALTASVKATSSVAHHFRHRRWRENE